MIVATCNRTEFYVVHHDTALADVAVRDAVRHLRGADLLAPGALRYAAADTEAARHLFRVASGLDSMVLGDAQILGQIKDAVALAREAGTVGPLLDRLVDRALRAGKRARAETSVSGGIVSVASAAVELLRTELTSLAGRRVLVIGAGETARLVARQLGQARLSSLLIANRTLEAAADLAASVGGAALALPDIAATLAGVDAVVSATRAPRFVVSAADVATAMAAAPEPASGADRPRGAARHRPGGRTGARRRRCTPSTPFSGWSTRRCRGVWPRCRASRPRRRGAGAFRRVEAQPRRDAAGAGAARPFRAGADRGGVAPAQARLGRRARPGRAADAGARQPPAAPAHRVAQGRRPGLR